MMHPELATRNPPWELIADHLTKKHQWGSFNKEYLLSKCASFHNLFALRPPSEKLSQREQIQLQRSAIDDEHDAALNALMFNVILPGYTWEQLIGKFTSLKFASGFQHNESDHNWYILNALPNFMRFFQLNDKPKPKFGHSDYDCMIVRPIHLEFSHVPLEDEYTENADEVYCDEDEKTCLDTSPAFYDEILDNAIGFVNDLLNRSLPRYDVPTSYYIDKMDGLTWAVLLCIRPDFSSECAWKKLDGTDFCLLMINRPSLRNHCDWSKFGGLEWSVLLAENPEFVKNCEANNGWSKFSDEDWQYLLDERPWMSKYRPTNTDSVTSPSRTT